MKEAYCSFEVAKLLKEKGFEVITYMVYDNQGNFDYQNCVCCNVDRMPCLYAPTHQMAMAWLREKGIHMSIDTVISSSGNIYFNIDTYSEDSGWKHPVDFYDSYDEAVETAIKYSLENLI